MLLGVKTRAYFEHRADVFSMHVVDREYDGAALEVNRHRSSGVAEIVAVIGRANSPVPVPGDLNSPRIVDIVLRFVLLAETAAVVQIAFKYIRRLNLEKIERN